MRVDQQQLQTLREQLFERKEEILNGAERTVGGMTQSKETFPDPTDRASLESSRNAMLRIRDRERKLLTKIDEALLRMDEGNYGFCEECDEPITFERLRARPVTTLCVECKAEQEETEHRVRRS